MKWFLRCQISFWHVTWAYYFEKLPKRWSSSNVHIGKKPAVPFHIILVAQGVHPILFVDFPCRMPPPHLSLKVRLSLKPALHHIIPTLPSSFRVMDRIGASGYYYRNLQHIRYLHFNLRYGLSFHPLQLNILYRGTVHYFADTKWYKTRWLIMACWDWVHGSIAIFYFNKTRKGALPGSLHRWYQSV